MKIIKGSRQSGKTTALIKKSSKEWKYIVCATRQRAELISTMAEQLGLDIPFPITVHELPIRSPRIKSVLVDDVEDVLRCFIAKPIDFATTSCKIEHLIFKSWIHDLFERLRNIFKEEQ